MNKYLIEFLGAFAIAYFGAFTRLQNVENVRVLALQSFVLLSALTQSFAYLSGAIFNPVVVVCLVLVKHLPPAQGLFYALTHVAASLLAGLFLLVTVPRLDTRAVYYGVPQLLVSNRLLASSLVAIGSLLLVLTFCSVLHDQRLRPFYGVAVGGASMVVISAFGGIEGGCLNLVELIGPGLVQLSFKDWHYYTLAQLAGGLLAVALFQSFVKFNPKEAAIEDDEDTGDEAVKNE